MHGERLPASPGIAGHRRARDVGHLLDHVALTEPVDLFLRSGSGRDRGGVGLAHRLDVPQPVVGKPHSLPLDDRAHTAATVMPAHDDVADPQDIDRVLEHREAVQVRVGHHVGQVAMDKQLAWQKPDDLVRRHTAVGTTDP
ncbi:MAG: hypothetical protein BWX86_02604 [Verrucomicrobia bacterium ADurb.Bin122]|nr:MAG: hypothetical protein BWX86_02604 [Verrucomicrobia bacterium ADurb.Bin122]